MVSPLDPTSNPYYDVNRLAGEEVSSTFEGRHILVQENDLVHVDNGDGLVDKGQPVSFGQDFMGQGVGIALKSAQVIIDAIPIDTEGVWRCTVSSLYGMVVGQIVFITSAGVLVDWPPDDTCHIFGYTLQPIAAPGNGDPTVAIVAVKVHWMDTGIWWWWFYWWQNYWK